MKYTYVITARCPLMLEPTYQCEQADEMILGWRAEILEEAAPGWVKVRADYRYEGYAPVECLCADEDQVNLFAAGLNSRVTACSRLFTTTNHYATYHYDCQKQRNNLFHNNTSMPLP